MKTHSFETFHGVVEFQLVVSTGRYMVFLDTKEEHDNIYLGDLVLTDGPCQLSADSIVLGYQSGKLRGRNQVREKFRELFYDILELNH